MVNNNNIYIHLAPFFCIQRDQDPASAQTQEHHQAQGDSDGQVRGRRLSEGQRVILPRLRLYGA